MAKDWRAVLSWAGRELARLVSTVLRVLAATDSWVASMDSCVEKKVSCDVNPFVRVGSVAVSWFKGPVRMAAKGVRSGGAICGKVGNWMAGNWKVGSWGAVKSRSQIKNKIKIKFEGKICN